MAELKERTFIAIKPDGVQRGIIGEIIKRFEAKGFKLVGMKMLHVSKVISAVMSAQGFKMSCFHNGYLCVDRECAG